MSATVAQEAEDQVDAGLTLSHGPGEKGAQCLAQVLDDACKSLLAHIGCCIHKVSAKMAMQRVVDMRVSETSAVD